ncbi:hypothetical protein BO79DRAFT_219741 [Aspergillus costaricaensis CBS 115574]|uniref:Uncharacterized protein n=1 Tax=Aspergillus costaricaensis CBS 115574 TaxID=1448317 RepID=A0ACD1I9Y0_9EURO|nr:hypothetical protein BO79DRAFT_219741 [Aspergillus costaricaensis CBS 115574]RAK86813.1 hypothetical protein BO79DRAFT_219741 [Aspergillus costaricaensis CBS 115574]
MYAVELVCLLACLLESWYLYIKYELRCGEVGCIYLQDCILLQIMTLSIIIIPTRSSYMNPPLTTSGNTILASNFSIYLPFTCICLTSCSAYCTFHDAQDYIQDTAVKQRFVYCTVCILNVSSNMVLPLTNLQAPPPT